MGVELILIGYIQEAWPGTAGENDEKQRKIQVQTLIPAHNNQTLSSLPEFDAWPPLCQGMFARPADNAQYYVYRHRIIHFGASMKNADFALRNWFDKFESLLRNLYWSEAYVRVDGGYIGTHEFHWTPTNAWNDQLYKGWLTPINEWNFTSTLPELDTLRESPQ
jgi:hypothetical protein